MATEKRLIDANAADVERIPCYYGDQCHTEDVQEWLNEQPTVDAVEVVRCKDCNQSEKFGGQLFCRRWGADWHAVSENAFCYYGEKREGENEND